MTGFGLGEPGWPGSRLFTWAELLRMWELGRLFERTRLLDLENAAAAAVARVDRENQERWAAHRAQTGARGPQR